MKLVGQLLHHSITIMIDSGASHNFIFETVVAHCSYLLKLRQFLGVTLGDGHWVSTFGVCQQLLLSLGNVDITANCFVFPLEGWIQSWVWPG